jgi:hypothetical protein
MRAAESRRGLPGHPRSEVRRLVQKTHRTGRPALRGQCRAARRSEHVIGREDVGSASGPAFLLPALLPVWFWAGAGVASGALGSRPDLRIGRRRPGCPAGPVFPAWRSGSTSWMRWCTPGTWPSRSARQSSSLHPAAATARRWTVSHLHPEQQRLVAHANRRHMTGDHHGRTAGRATLLIRTVDGFSARTGGRHRQQTRPEARSCNGAPQDPNRSARCIPASLPQR